MSVESFSAIRPQVEKIIRNYIETTFGQRPNYDVKLAQKWSNEAAEEIIKHVQDEKGQEFKFTCTIIILEKGEVGFHMSASCFWEGKSDGNLNQKFEFQDYYVIVNFFGITRSN